MPGKSTNLLWEDCIKQVISSISVMEQGNLDWKEVAR